MTSKFLDLQKEDVTARQKGAPVVWVHESVIEVSVKFLRESRGFRSRHEGVVYWAGRDFGPEWLVTTCFAPKAKTTSGSYKTSSETNAKVIASMAASNLQMLAQVHSHPKDWVGHSDGDNWGALMPYENLLSIIVPSYARQGILPLTRCGVHRFEHGTFRQLSNPEVVSTFQLLPTAVDFRRQ